MDGNGTADWQQTRLAGLRGTSLSSGDSLVSPVCFEGTSSDAGLLTLVAGGAAYDVRPAIGDGWFADIPLSPTCETVIAVSVAGETSAVSNVVRWVALNLFEAPTNTFLIRAGSALKLDAIPASHSNGAVSIEVVGVTNHITTAGAPVIQSFGAGSYLVKAAFSNAVTSTNCQILVNGIGAAFPYEPLCVLGKSRTWTCSGVPREVAVLADPRLAFSMARPASNTVAMTFTSFLADPQRIVMRLGDAGPILDAVAVHTASLASTDQQRLDIQQAYDDGRQLVAVTINLGGVRPDVSMRINISGGGATLDDGTLSRWVDASDFTESGQYTYYLIRAVNAPATFCHTTTLYQGGQQIVLSW